jgi:uncharacterized iron-regulated membrane protein
MTLRKILFWMHLCIGVTAGLVILAMSVTGVMLAFEHQIVAWTDRGYNITPSSNGQRLAIDELVVKAQAAQESPPTGILLRSDPALPIEFSFGRERTVLVNPYTGEILTTASRSRAVFAQVENVHRWLAMPESKRTLGESITGACTLAFLGLILSGPFLWWPREWNWTSVQKILFFKSSVGLRRTLWNWHHVFGIWCVVPLFFIAITGVVMAYPWANNLLYRLTGNQPPPPQARVVLEKRPPRAVDDPGAQTSREGKARPDEPHRMALDDLFALAQKQAPDWKSVSSRLTGPARGPITFFIDTGSGGRPDLRSQLILNSETGDIIRWERFETYNLGRRLRTWARFTHTGEAGGIVGEAIAALAASGASMLVFTGLCLAIRRLYLWRSRSRN